MRDLDFGKSVSAANASEPAAWIAAECDGAWGTVGALVPNRYESILHIEAPAAGRRECVPEYRELFRCVAATGERYSVTPDRAWFAVWEGHGFGSRANSRALQYIPRFDLPHRRYYLLSGRTSAAALIEDPETGDWRWPDLFWPDDRQWFVATDTDLWCLYVGGRSDFITELASRVATKAKTVGPETRLEAF